MVGMGVAVAVFVGIGVDVGVGDDVVVGDTAVSVAGIAVITAMANVGKTGCGGEMVGVWQATKKRVL